MSFLWHDEDIRKETDQTQTLTEQLFLFSIVKKSSLLYSLVAGGQRGGVGQRWKWSVSEFFVCIFLYSLGNYLPKRKPHSAYISNVFTYTARCISDQSVHLARWRPPLEQVTVRHLVKWPHQLNTWSSAFPSFPVNKRYLVQVKPKSREMNIHNMSW